MGLDPVVIRDTIHAVFRNAAYHESPPSLWSVIAGWLSYWFGRLLMAIASHPAAGAVIRIALIVAIAALVVRIGYAFYLHLSTPSGALHAFTTTRSEEWWLAAQRFAAHGQYTEAAHALYLALLTAIARRGLLTMHRSKTIGDYTRELRPHAEPATFSRFRDFARSYETVVYGLGVCDAPRYEQLRAIAEPMLAPLSASNA